MRQIPGPPLDPVYYEPGGGCDPSPDPQPCDPMPTQVGYDKTYPSRLIAWAKDVLP